MRCNIVPEPGVQRAVYLHVAGMDLPPLRLLQGPCTPGGFGLLPL